MITTGLFDRRGRANKTEHMNLLIIPRGRVGSEDSPEDESYESWLSFVDPRKAGHARADGSAKEPAGKAREGERLRLAEFAREPAGKTDVLFIATEGDVSQEASGTTLRLSTRAHDPVEVARAAVAGFLRSMHRVGRFSERRPGLLLGMVCTALALSVALFVLVALGLLP